MVLDNSSCEGRSFIGKIIVVWVKEILDQISISYTELGQSWANGSISVMFISNCVTKFKKEEKRFQINRLRLSPPGLANIFVSIQDCFLYGGSSGIGRMVNVFGRSTFFSELLDLLWEIFCMLHQCTSTQWLRTEYSSLTEVNLCKYFTENIIWFNIFP